jgi:uncharacterized membrane protein YeaQ/YmgE (transglycosylase-associated protein family)
MGILAWIIFGALAGWLSSLIMNTSENQGFFLNVIVGIVGAFIGGMVMNFFGSVGVTGFNLRSFIVAVVGACLALALLKLLRK